MFEIFESINWFAFFFLSWAAALLPIEDSVAWTFLFDSISLAKLCGLKVKVFSQHHPVLFTLFPLHNVNFFFIFLFFCLLPPPYSSSSHLLSATCGAIAIATGIWGFDMCSRQARNGGRDEKNIRRSPTVHFVVGLSLREKKKEKHPRAGCGSDGGWCSSSSSPFWICAVKKEERGRNPSLRFYILLQPRRQTAARPGSWRWKRCRELSLFLFLHFGRMGGGDSLWLALNLFQLLILLLCCSCRAVWGVRADGVEWK